MPVFMPTAMDYSAQIAALTLFQFKKMALKPVVIVEVWDPIYFNGTLDGSNGVDSTYFAGIDYPVDGTYL